MHLFFLLGKKSVDILSILAAAAYFFASFYDIKIQFAGSF